MWYENEILGKNSIMRLVWFLLLILISTLKAQAFQQSATRNVFSIWHFNEGTGTTTPDSIKGIVGTLSNGAAWVAGKHSNALQFDGVTSGVDYTDKDEFSPGVNNVTILLSMRTSPGYATGDPVISKGQTDQYEFRLAAPNGVPGVLNLTTYNLAGSINPLSLTGFAVVNDGKWHRIGFSHYKSASGALVILWVDGKLDNQGTQNATTMGNGTSALKTGGGAWQSEASGTIEDVTVYTRILTLAEIKYDYLLWRGRVQNTQSY